MSDEEAEHFGELGRQIVDKCGEGSIIVAGALVGRILAALDETTSEISIVEAREPNHPRVRLVVAETLRAYETLGRNLIGTLEAMTPTRRKRFHALLVEKARSP